MRGILLSLLFAIFAPLAFASDHDSTNALIKRGSYLVSIAGCNDCHTAGFAPSGGKIPQSEWLKGDSLGYSGPWGTTYPTNLRLRLAEMDLATWKSYARAVVLRPPMPYWALNTMDDMDLDAIWHFTRSLGKAGTAAPAALPPGVEPPLPAFTLKLPTSAAATP